MRNGPAGCLALVAFGWACSADSPAVVGAAGGGAGPSGGGQSGAGPSSGGSGGSAGTGFDAAGGGGAGGAGGQAAGAGGGFVPDAGGNGGSPDGSASDGSASDGSGGGSATIDGPAGDVRTTDGSTDGRGETGPSDSVVWAIDNLQSIGGHPTSLSGAPTVIDTPAGKAVQFDGVDDALFVENNPVSGFSQFTVEVVFRPDVDGAAEQRFFHITENGNNNRVLFETRLPSNAVWILDTFVESKAGGAALFDAQLVHPIGSWYHAAVVVDGTRVRDYVNGVEEVTVPLAFQPLVGGRTSIGVRVNKLYWYKGAIRLARFTPRVLSPADFL